MYCNGVPPRVTSFIRVYPEYLLYIVDTNVYLLSQDGKTSLYLSWGTEDIWGVNINFKHWDLLYKEEGFRWKAPIKRYNDEEWRRYTELHWSGKYKEEWKELL